jgi:hypothetical protein
MQEPGMLVNFTNHPSEKWSLEQIQAATKYGEIRDMLFPGVDPAASEAEIEAMAEQYCDRIESLAPAAVLCQGEFTLCYSVVQRLHERGIRVFAACSKRDVIEKETEDGSTEKLAVFSFVRFREYAKG